MSANGPLSPGGYLHLGEIPWDQLRDTQKEIFRCVHADQQEKQLVSAAPWLGDGYADSCGQSSGPEAKIWGPAGSATPTPATSAK